MAGEAEAVSVLTLLVAVCEQAIIAMESLDPPADGQVVDVAQNLRDLAIAEIRVGRLRRREPGGGDDAADLVDD